MTPEELLDEAVVLARGIGASEPVDLALARQIALGWCDSGLVLTSPHDPDGEMDVHRAVLAVLTAANHGQAALAAGADPAWLRRWAADGLLPASRDEITAAELDGWAAVGEDAGLYAAAGMSPAEAVAARAGSNAPTPEALAHMAALAGRGRLTDESDPPA